MKTSIVIVGMERSKFAGNCPGSELDARRMNDLLLGYSTDIKLFLNENATYSNVRQALEEAVKADFCIFYYSGHGGSERFSDTGQEETDGRDEFLCLYDRMMRDNDVWEITSRSNGRVYEIYDCCHSQTMFRSPGITFKAIPMERGAGSTQNLLVWSGCPDDTFSYGSSSGGQMTNTFLKYFSKNSTYSEIWRKLSSDRDLKRYETVQKTLIGEFPEENPIFT